MKRLLFLLLIPATAAFGMEQQHEAQLFDAVHHGNAKAVDNILRSSRNPKALANSSHGGIAVLREAATNGNSEVIKTLIRNGAKADAPDGYNMTPLMLAVLQGHKDAAFWLIKLGADVNAKDMGGQSVLNWVDFGGGTTPQQKAELKDMLIKAGAK